MKNKPQLYKMIDICRWFGIAVNLFVEDDVTNPIELLWELNKLVIMIYLEKCMTQSPEYVFVLWTKDKTLSTFWFNSLHPFKKCPAWNTYFMLIVMPPMAAKLKQYIRISCLTEKKINLMSPHMI